MIGFTETEWEKMLAKQKAALAAQSVVLPEKYQYIKSIIEGGPKRVKVIRPYYFWSPTFAVNVGVSTLSYYYHTLETDTVGTLTAQTTLSNLPTNLMYFGNLYYQIQPPSVQTAAYQVNIGVTSYQKSGAIRSQIFQRLDAFDDGYNTYPTHTGTLAAAVNGWTKPNNVYERQDILFHCFALQINTNATGTIQFNAQVKFSGYQIETTDA